MIAVVKNGPTIRWGHFLFGMAYSSSKKLTTRQKAAMERHAEHHTKKHMAEMRRLMKAGKTFTEAHKMAMKKVGR